MYVNHVPVPKYTYLKFIYKGTVLYLVKDVARCVYVYVGRYIF